MESLRSWIADPQLAQSAWLGLIVKLTLVLGLAWLAYEGLGRANPRWRRLVWRTTAVGCAMLAISPLFPPLLSWAILTPAPRAIVVAAKAEPRAVSPAAEVNPKAAGLPNPQFAGQQDFELSEEALMERRSFERIVDDGMEDLNAGAGPQNDRDATNLAPVQVSATPSSVMLEESRGPFWSWKAILLTVWIAGIALLLVQTLLGVLRLGRIRRHATAAPAAVNELASSIAQQLGCRRVPQILVSDDVTSPCILGIRRPVVLLPAAERMPVGEQELPAILAHELAHLRGHDVAWQLAIHGVATLCWFHPLSWRMRAAHALACDEVSDAVAAHYLGDAAAYGRTLARLALRSMPTAATGMAMAQGSTVRQRIEKVQRRLFPAALTRWRVLSAVAVALTMFLLVGGFAIAQAEPKQDPAKTNRAESAKPTATEPATVDAGKGDSPEAEAATAELPKADKPPAETTPAETPKAAVTGPSVKVHVVDEKDQPVVGAKIRFNGRLSGKRFDRYLKTDAEGRAKLELPAGKTVDRMRLQCDKPGLVSVDYLWDGETAPVELPAEVELRLATGVPASGLVQDEQGKPIAGAKVEIHMPITWPDRPNHVFTFVDVKTDAEGRWQSPSMPVDLSPVTVNVTHPDYIRAFGKFAGRRENVAVLTQGLKVTGRVTNAAGQPVAKARVALGTDRFGTSEPESKTDKDGRFELKNCKEGKSIVTVQADGFSPQFKDVIVAPGEQELNFQLTPGHVVRVRVVDPRGNPIQAAYFCTDTWRGYRPLDLRIQTDVEGRAQWNGAPDDTVLCDLFKTGHMSNRDVPVKASDEELTITLPDELVISGKVTDAVTGQPLPAFGVRSGRVFESSDRVYLSQDEPTKYQNGEYRFKFDEPSHELLLEFSAEGYKPLQSKHFAPTDGQQTLDVRLTPAAGTPGLVLLADGQPAVGAEVGLTTQDVRVYLANGRCRRGFSAAPIVKTDASGKFTLAPRNDEPFALIVVHDAGYAQVLGEDFAKSNEIKLTPWGRLEGHVLLGDKPDVDREVSFWSKSDSPHNRFAFTQSFSTQTDTEGRYAFDRVIPGPGQVSRVVVTKFSSGTSHAPGWQVPVDVPAGELLTVNIGGKGRPVVGQVVLDRQPDVAISWLTNEPAMLSLREDGVKDRTFFRCGAKIDREGRFQIPDVPAGEYELAINVNNPPTPNACGAGDAIGRGTLKVVVPPMEGERSSEPLDVGTITAKLFDTLEPGELAPDFVLNGLNGKDVRLAEFHGKLVLLDFWATWCGPCLAEMPQIADIQKTFGDNPRFALIGLSVDQEIGPPQEYVTKNGLSWTHAHAGASGAGIGGIAAKYDVRSIPATFLIGPDGRVLAKNLRGPELKRAVAAALADEDLFKPAE